MNTVQMLALAQREQSNLGRGFRSDALVESDLAHERDMARLRKEQPAADISVEEANAEMAEAWDEAMWDAF